MVAIPRPIKGRRKVWRSHSAPAKPIYARLVNAFSEEVASDV